MLGAV